MEEKTLIGHFAVSLAGKDTGRVFVITGVCEDGRLLLADGRQRKVENPKQKKKKHLQILPQTLPVTAADNGIARNGVLRKATGEVQRKRETDTFSPN